MTLDRVLELPPVTRAEARCRVADAIVDRLEAAGVDVVFGLPGGPISPLNDALFGRGHIQQVTTKHENAAMFAAIGHARASGVPGVVLVTSGPGILNGLCGLASAWCDNAPVVVLVGEVPHRKQGRNALQDGSEHGLDLRGATRGFTKAFHAVRDPRQAVLAVAEAIASSQRGRPGPVVVTLPMDVLRARVSLPALELVEPGPAVSSPGAALEAIGDSRAGVLFAGNGARGGEGPAALLRLAEHLAWPVVTTPKGKGVFPESHPLAAGVHGAGGHASAREVLEGDADLVVALGTSLGELATDGWHPRLAAERRLVQVDVDPTQATRNYDLSHFVQSAVAPFCRAACEALPPRSGPSVGYAVSRIPEAEGDAITPAGALRELQRLVGPGACYVVDNGEHHLFAVHHLRLDRPDAFVAQSGLGSMGASVGAAIGVQLASPRRAVVALCGDGGFTMAGCDVATAARLEAPVIFVVFDDGRLGMVEHGHRDIYGRSPRFTPERVDLVAMAGALGAGARRIRRAGELATVDLDELTAQGRRPAALVVDIDPSARMPKNARTVTMEQD